MPFNNIKNQITYFVSSFFPKDSTVWAFGGWLGERFGDNSGAFLLYMAENHPENCYYWYTNHPDQLKKNLPSNVHIVKRNTKEARKILLKARFKIMCQGADDFDDLNLIGGSVTVQLWHGVAWKKIGIDSFVKQNGIIGKLKHISSIWAHSLQHNGKLFVATSELYADNIRSAFMAKDQNIYRCGFPRNCIFYDAKAYIQKRQEILERLHLCTDVKLVLYMPTFREKGARRFSFWDASDSFFCLDNIIILEKSHFADRQIIEKQRNSSLRIIDVSDFDAQELLLVSDLLITDYSSCFFDYLLLDRPIIQFIYDYEYYKAKDRGLYYSDMDVDCGHIARTTEEMYNDLKLFAEDSLSVTEQQMMVKSKFMTYENPDNNERLYQEICHKFGIR